MIVEISNTPLNFDFKSAWDTDDALASTLTGRRGDVQARLKSVEQVLRVRRAAIAARQTRIVFTQFTCEHRMAVRVANYK